MKLPTDIQDIIFTYQKDFERVDSLISDCISQYTDIVDQTDEIITHMFGLPKEICEFHESTVRKALSKIVNEAGKILNDILQEEEIYLVQIEMLSALKNEIMFTVFNVILHPFNIPRML